eukprot:gene8166-41405_t
MIEWHANAWGCIGKRVRQQWHMARLHDVLLNNERAVSGDAAGALSPRRGVSKRRIREQANALPTVRPVPTPSAAPAMALNQGFRAYNRIDSSQPQGNWIEEASVNETAGFGANRGAGGFSSSAFLVNPHDSAQHWALDDGKAHFLSVKQASYNDSSADITQGKRPPPGVRRRR